MAERSKHEIGQRIRELREERQISQHVLAEALGIDKSAVSRMESGDRALAASELGVAAAILDVPLDAILFSEDVDEVLLRAEGDGEHEESLRFADSLIDDFLAMDALVR